MIAAASNVKEVRIQMTKVLADGTTVPAGELYWHKNPLMRIWHRLKGALTW